MTTPSFPVKNRRKRTAGWQSRDVVRSAALVLGLYYVTKLFWFAHPLFLVAFLGILFGLAVSSGVDVLQRWRIPRGIGAPLIVITFVGSLVLFGHWVAPTLRAQSTELRRKLPESLDRIEHWLDAKKEGALGMVSRGTPKRDSTVPPASQITVNQGPGRVPSTDTTGPTMADGLKAAPGGDSVAADGSLRTQLGQQVSHLTKYLFPVLSSTVEVVAGLLIIIFMSIYIAVDPGLYHRGLLAMFPHRHRTRVGEVLSAISAVLRRWLVTQLIAMAVMGVVTTIVLVVLHVKAAVALGVLAGLLEFVPTVGAILSSVPAIAMGFLDTPEKAVTVTIAYVGIHFIENHILIPLLMKGRVNLPPALTVTALSLSAMLFGFLGLMCAVPLLAAGTVAVKMLYVDRVIGEPEVALRDLADVRIE